MLGLLRRIMNPVHDSKEDIRLEEMHKLVEVDLAHIRATDPETEAQWLRLQRSLSSRAVKARPVQSRLIPRLAFAFVMIAAAGVGAYVLLIPRSLAPEMFSTQKGEQTQVVLRDNSEVVLNAASELAVVHMERGKPRLLSLKGEALFRVKRNEMPFIVSTEYGDIHVVGTEFNVRSREGRLDVTVVHGIVRVSIPRNGSTLTLTQGQSITCMQDGVLERSNDISLADFPVWLHGRLYFDKATVAEACREIEIRFNIATAIGDPLVGKERVTGLLNAKNAESALYALCTLTGKKLRHDGEVYTIY